MQKFLNDPANMIEESMQGFLKSHCDLVKAVEYPLTIKLKAVPIPGKVGIVNGGGYGYDPAFMGFLGPNTLDTVAIGDIFTPPFCRGVLSRLSRR